ncbi:PAS domain S-box protein [Couchioplanes caeruleus]|uniref:hybrid sensor histidine kinase/response regulator n=1 Tax=Couchioplanes caeruleus TaxID=56438 RepID=UPI0020BDDDC7|nr:PAS domain-containing hybrid sensor histidine kinase/response regulator [Couchioplanes caeruleus]UQU62990.1 PAS domain S-box protein [Couchioplanes caeruleus]
MATLAVTALYAMIFFWVSGTYLRRPDPLLRDVMLIFASVASYFALSAIRLVAEPPDVVRGLVAAVVLAQPFLSLRLVSRVRVVPRWSLYGAAAAWAASAVLLVTLKVPLPSRFGLSIAAAAFVVEAAAAVLLAAEARRRGGAARMRLACAAIGTGLFGVVIMTAREGQAVFQVALVVAVISAMMYFLAFLPPRYLRRVWSWGAAYALIRRMLAAPAGGTAEWIWREYCRAARESLGLDGVMVLVREPDGTVKPVCDPAAAPAGEPYGEEDLRLLLARTGMVDALAGWSDPPRIAVDMARVTRTRYVCATALAGPGGALLLLHRHRTLFTDDDMALVSKLAGQAAALADRADVLAERERLAVIVEASDDAIISKAMDGTIASWNTGARRVFGYETAEVLGRPSALLFAPGEEGVAADVLARVTRGERVDQLEVQGRRKDGSTVPVSFTSSPITDAAGRPVGIACVARDIGQRQRAEAMFRELLEGAPDAILGVGEDGRIVLLNAEAERMFGYRREELLGQSIEVLVPAGVRPRHSHLRDDYFADPQRRPMAAGMALKAVRKDGDEFPVEISLSALRTDQGLIVSASVRDVTVRVQEQAERERLAAQTERDAVDRRLQHTRRLESLGQLAGGVAHDFNNILAVIASYTELLTETLAEAQPDPADLAAARKDLTQIGRATERATRLTKQLLAFGRREITQAQVLSVNHVVGDVDQLLRRTLGEHIHLITHLDRDLWPVCADPGQIEQVLVNLAVNARDAMPAGGTLSIDTGNTHLDEDDVAECPDVPAGRYVRVRVSDTGVGMPPEVTERAFEPFFTTKPQGAGTGLGLATVYGIAASAGGHVRLHSEPGIGTTVTLVLPATDAAVPVPEEAEASEAAPSPGTPQETILLVEDEDALREATGRALSRAGYRVLAASGGAAALRLAEDHQGPIHLLLTDVMMPVMMGNEVAARVQRIRPDLAVLYMSGYAQPVLTENGTLPEGVVIIEKPFTRQALLDQVRARLLQASDL